MLRHAVVLFRHFPSELRVGQHQSSLADSRRCNVAVEFDHPEAFGFDVHVEDRVVVDDQGPPKVNGFEKSVAEALQAGGIRHEISVRIHIPQGVNLAAIGRLAAPLTNDIRNKIDRHFQQFGKFAHAPFVVVALVAGGV